MTNLKIILFNFGTGIKRIFLIHRQRNLKYLLRTSIIILIAAESVLTAETVDLIFYNYSLLLSIPPALLAGAFAVVAPEAFKKSRHKK
jgi:hypothetical protein